VLIDPGQLEQVIVNLAVNGRDAMPDGGQLVIETADVELDAAYVGTHRGVRPGPYVLLAVSDTGCGMDAETCSHIFEPFFTTKEPGKGTGLGLSVVFGIVNQSGGSIEVYSEPGHGSSFKIYLPRAAAGATTRKEAATVVAAPQGGSETVLVIEDEPALRELLRRLLEAAGYTVLLGETVAAAMSLAERHGGPIHVVLTDVVMPGTSGPEAAARLVEGHPEARLLFMSGYAANAMSHRQVLPPGAVLLEKPFTADGLLRGLRAVLSADR
jgi:two-component system, cell cycle sensor histidine kinase and response regulator CckA